MSLSGLLQHPIAHADPCPSLRATRKKIPRRGLLTTRMTTERCLISNTRSEIIRPTTERVGSFSAAADLTRKSNSSCSYPQTTTESSRNVNSYEIFISIILMNIPRWWEQRKKKDPLRSKNRVWNVCWIIYHPPKSFLFPSSENFAPLRALRLEKVCVECFGAMLLNGK